MSLLNVWASPSRVLVGVDTLAAADSGPEFGIGKHTSKMFAMPHAGVVLAGRGHSAVLGRVFFSLVATFVSDLDSMDSMLPQLMRQSAVGLITKRRELGFDRPEVGKQQLVLSGYSIRRHQMIALLYTLDEGGEASRTEIGGDGDDGDWLSAWDADQQGEAPAPDSSDAMREVMRLQVEHLRRALPDAQLARATTGGRAIVAELTAGRVCFHDAGHLA